MAHVWALPQTTAVYLITGSEDAIVHVAVTDSAELRETVLNGISTGVVDEQTSLVFEHSTKRVVAPTGGDPG